MKYCFHNFILLRSFVNLESPGKPNLSPSPPFSSFIEGSDISTKRVSDCFCCGSNIFSDSQVAKNGFKSLKEDVCSFKLSRRSWQKLSTAGLGA